MRHPVKTVKRGYMLFLVLLFIPFSQAEDFFFDSAGVKIHYVIEGKGEPVLLIHGFLADLQVNWGRPGSIEALSDTFQVIAIDNRGHGKSDKPHNPDAYGLNMVEDSIRLLDHLKIRKAHVVGYSMGGVITLGIVTRYPERVHAAVIGGAGLNPPGQSIQPMMKILADALEKGNLGPLIVGLAPAGAPKPTPEQMESMNKAFLASGKDMLAMAAVARNFPPEAAEAQVRSSRIPVLALVGEMDPAKPTVDRLDGLMPNAKIVVIPKADHGTAFSNPEFIRNLKSFLLENSADAGEGLKK